MSGVRVSVFRFQVSGFLASTHYHQGQKGTWSTAGLLPLLGFFFTLVTGPRRSLSLKLSDKRVYEPQIRALLGNHNTPILGFYRKSYLTRRGHPAGHRCQRRDPAPCTLNPEPSPPPVIAQGSECRVQGSGFRVQGSGFRAILLDIAVKGATLHPEP